MKKGRGSDRPDEACLLHMGVLLVRAGSYKAPAKVLQVGLEIWPVPHLAGV